MHESFDNRAAEYHAALPGLIRATLLDFGVGDASIDRHLLGWNGEHLTVPVRNKLGHVQFFEFWDAARIGVPVNKRDFVALFGSERLREMPPRVLIAEGIHEALILEGLGLTAVSATDTGRFFKQREWAPALSQVPKIFLAYRRGKKRDRGKFLPSRTIVVESVRGAVPQARRISWPGEVGDQGGAYEYFVTLSHDAEDFQALLANAQ